MTNPSDHFPTALAAAATATAAAVALSLAVSLPLLQLDLVSRKILDPKRLRVKRRKQQLYEMDKSVEIQRLRAKSAVQTAAAESDAATAAPTAVGDDGTKNGKTDRSRLSTWRYNPRSDRVATELLTAQSDYDDLVRRILDKKEKGTSPYIVAIGRDEETEAEAKLDGRELYLWLAFPPPEPSSSSSGVSSSGGMWRRVQVPLVPFLQTLSDEFENQITSTALCFVADSSSGLAADVLHSVLEGCNAPTDDGGKGAGLALVKEPTWMVVMSRIIQANLIKKDNVVRVLFGLCRLEAWRLRDRVGT